MKGIAKIAIIMLIASFITVNAYLTLPKSEKEKGYLSEVLPVSEYFVITQAQSSNETHIYDYACEGAAGSCACAGLYSSCRFDFECQLGICNIASCPSLGNATVISTDCNSASKTGCNACSSDGCPL